MNQLFPQSTCQQGQDGLIGPSASLQRLREKISRVAGAPRTTVLITGESGVGKEVVARSIHQRSDRRDGPFVALNCAALNEGLLESELFGHEAGAYTGASSKGREGLFAAAKGGTLLLDEIGELAPQTSIIV
jgi:transcriptional regulator with PAS, ATPase and Fis domain